VHEGLPEGPEWKDVQRLVKGAEGGGPATIRARVILLLFAIYGLRSGEVARLQLSDVDWRAETFTVSHSKRGLAIPSKRFTRTLVKFLTRPEDMATARTASAQSMWGQPRRIAERPQTMARCPQRSRRRAMSRGFI
jgi:site-specific recombinase XerD